MFAVSEGGLVVTLAQIALELVQVPGPLQAQLSDGRLTDVIEVAGLDPARNLIALRLESSTSPLPLGREVLLEPHARVFGVSEHGDVVEGRVEAAQAVAEGLVIYLLSGPPEWDPSGQPLVDAEGQVLGVGALATGPSGQIAIGIPRRYLTSLLRGTPMPLFMLRRMAARPRVERRVPVYPTTMLVGAEDQELRVIAAAIGDAIHRGAPAYNAGDIADCARIYAATAHAVMAQHPTVEGATQALEAGLQRAQGLSDPDARAWALRDAFDGLLSVIERYLAGPQHLVDSGTGNN